MAESIYYVHSSIHILLPHVNTYLKACMFIHFLDDRALMMVSSYKLFQMASPALESMCCLFNESAEVDRPGHHHLSAMPLTVYNTLCILSGTGTNVFPHFLPPASATRSR